MRHAGDFISFAVFICVAVAVLVGLPFSWSEWRREMRQTGGSLRRFTVTCAIFLATLEVLLSVAMLAFFRGNWIFAKIWFVAEVICLLLATGCSFTWKGPARWWLRACCFNVPIISFILFVGLTAE
jgi:hypothetical protein